jgi:isopenicillin N synthase-like dioxygenase
VDGKPKQKLPKSFASHVEELADFEERCSSTCHRIFRLLAMGLDVRAFPCRSIVTSSHGNDA